MKKILAHPHFIPWFLFIFFTSLYFASTVGVMNSLDGSQYALTQALVEEKNIKIDSFMKWTYWTDYAVSGKHYYSDRDPGVSFLAVPFYIIAKQIHPISKVPYDGQNRNADKDSALQSLAYLTTCLFGGLTVTLVYLICLHFKRSKKASIITAFAVGTGTLLWKYSASFYREPVFITIILLVFYILFKTQDHIKENQINSWFFLVVGLFSGLALFVDNSKPYVIILIFAYICPLGKKYFKKIVSIFLIGLLLSVGLLFLYNFIAFGNPFINGYLEHGYVTWMREPKNLFRTPLLSSLMINLFNNAPIPEKILSFFWDNPYISHQMGAKWATFWKYKGIFVQTPLLFLSIIGWYTFFKKYPKDAFIVIITLTSILIINSKLTTFWAPNTYDSRYFLPVTILLLFGLPFFIDNIFKIKIFFFRLYRYLLLLLLFGFSLYNGWYSNLTNFAPHVSGEHRFSFSQLAQPVMVLWNIKYNLWLLFTNTFPNIYNLHILFIFYFLPILLIYFLYKFYVYLLSPKPKRLLPKNIKYRS